MQWKKLGKIFDPRDHSLPNDCEEFAQSPQALTFKDFTRIYFSTRQKDILNGKFLSHVAYVDMTHDLKSIISVSTKPVIELGKLGCFDEHGIFPINVLHHQGKVYAYTCGWSRRVSTSVETGIGFATSNDGGETFTKLGDGPILGASLREPFLVGDAFVRHFRGQFHMWYMFGTSWKVFEEKGVPERIYKIGHATSNDGIVWCKTQEGQPVIPDKLNAEESMALPTVVSLFGRYHMFFCYRESCDFRTNTKRGYRIGYASSDDLVSWTRDDELGGLNISGEGWDSDMMCYPHVYQTNDKVYMLYNGNEFGRYGFGAAELIAD